MSKAPCFKTPLILRPLPGRRWRIKAPFIYQSKIAGGITVPVTFECDLNSIPRFLWWASTPTDYAEAGVIHDFLYATGMFPRNVADQVYREALQLLGMGRIRRNLRYRAVRLFGGPNYADQYRPFARYGESY